MVSFAFVVLIAAATGLIGYISLRNGQSAVEDVATQFQTQVFANIREKLGDYLTIPHRLNQLNAAMMAQNPALIQDLEGLLPIYLRQLQAFDSVETVAIGIEKQGNFAAKKIILKKKEETRTLLKEIEARIGTTIDKLMSDIDYEN